MGVEVDEALQASVIRRAWNGEFDVVADLDERGALAFKAFDVEKLRHIRKLNAMNIQALPTLTKNVPQKVPTSLLSTTMSLHPWLQPTSTKRLHGNTQILPNGQRTSCTSASHVQPMCNFFFFYPPFFIFVNQNKD